MFSKSPHCFHSLFKAPLVNLHGVYRLFTGDYNPLASSNYMVLSCFSQAPFLIYMVFTQFLEAPCLFVVFKHGLYLFLKGSFFIYMGFTFSLQAPRFIYMVFTCMSLTGSLFSLRWVLHVSHSPPFFHFHVFFLHVSYGLPFFIYMVFTGLQTKHFQTFHSIPLNYFHVFHML